MKPLLLRSLPRAPPRHRGLLIEHLLPSFSDIAVIHKPRDGAKGCFAKMLVLDAQPNLSLSLPPFLSLFVTSGSERN